ncbi:hypothetical protein, partial [Klebsiella pneumoniae]|uniref:hypothetical protein n=1 Tax=Klebsiella pneumoniae TaxID=573 RepID=UPI00371BB0FE
MRVEHVELCAGALDPQQEIGQGEDRLSAVIVKVEQGVHCCRERGPASSLIHVLLFQRGDVFH